MWCRHKYGEVAKDGYQYCKKCGKAIAVSAPCQHKWERLDTLERTSTVTGNVKGFIYVSRCVKCGEITQTEIGRQL